MRIFLALLVALTLLFPSFLLSKDDSGDKNASESTSEPSGKDKAGKDPNSFKVRVLLGLNTKFGKDFEPDDNDIHVLKDPRGFTPIMGLCLTTDIRIVELVQKRLKIYGTLDFVYGLPGLNKVYFGLYDDPEPYASAAYTMGLELSAGAGVGFLVVNKPNFSMEVGGRALFGGNLTTLTFDIDTTIAIIETVDKSQTAFGILGKGLVYGEFNFLRVNSLTIPIRVEAGLPFGVTGQISQLGFMFAVKLGARF